MLQKEMDSRDWRYDDPFDGGVPYGTTAIHASPKRPPRAYCPTPEMSEKKNSFPSRISDRPSQMSQSPHTSGTNSPSLQVPPVGTWAVTNPSRRGSSRQGSPSSRRSEMRRTDPEKSTRGGRSTHTLPSSNLASHQSTIVYEEADEDEKDHPKNHAIQILLHLSSLNPLLAFAFTAYALSTSLVILLLSPLCLCTVRKPIRTHFTKFLVPPLHFQLGMLFSDRQHEHDIHQSTAMLLLCYLFAPFVAIGVCVAAWVAAAFWMFAKILGNPNVNESKEDEGNEGRAAVMAVRNFWEAWLLRGLR